MHFKKRTNPPCVVRHLPSEVWIVLVMNLLKKRSGSHAAWSVVAHSGCHGEWRHRTVTPRSRAPTVCSCRHGGDNLVLWRRGRASIKYSLDSDEQNWAIQPSAQAPTANWRKTQIRIGFIFIKDVLQVGKGIHRDKIGDIKKAGCKRKQGEGNMQITPKIRGEQANNFVSPGYKNVENAY